jgi:hypothetical protein
LNVPIGVSSLYMRIRVLLVLLFREISI